MTEVGLYGGSFDPIHNGHLNLAIQLMEHHQLDQVWFIPAAVSPHKQDEGAPVDAHHRLRMVELATEEIAQFRVVDDEIRRGGASYTVETVRNLMSKPDAPNMRLILGDDQIQNFHRWREVEELIELVPLLIGSRYTFDAAPASPESPAVEEAIQQGLTETAVMEISATNIRQRLSQKMFCGHLIPHKVLDYIEINHLYC